VQVSRRIVGCAAGITVGAAAAVGSLFLTWYSGVDDGGRYTASGWSALNGVDIMLAGAAAVAWLAALTALEAPHLTSRARAVAMLAGLAALAAAIRGFVGTADDDYTLATPEVGIFVALLASILILVAAVALVPAGPQVTIPLAGAARRVRRSVVRRWRLLVAMVVVVLVMGFAVEGVREGRLTRAAATAAVIAVEGDDPTAGANGSCEYAPGASLVLLRARFHCVVKLCHAELAKLDVTHVVLGGWSYTATRQSSPALMPRSGSTYTAPQGNPRLVPGDCP
jgi:hypothetical protein